MNKAPPPPDPDAYIATLDGWRRELVVSLRDSVRKAAKMQEAVKWGHLVYSAGGPVMLIRAEAARVLLGFWRGQRLTSIEPRLKAGGKYEMATLELKEGMSIEPAIVRRLTRAAVKLNQTLGNPTEAAKGKR